MTSTREHKPRRRLRYRLSRIVVLAAIALLLMGGVGFWLVTRSSVLISLIEPALEKQVGGTVTIGSARLTSPKHIVLQNVTVEVPDHIGDAAQILHAEIFEIVADTYTDVFHLLEGDSTSLTLSLTNARFRFSEDSEQPGTFSFMSLDRKPLQDTGPPADVRIEIHNGVLEVGSHTGNRYEKSGELPVAGSFNIASDAPDWLVFLLNETDTKGNPLDQSGLRVQGRINMQSFATEGRITGLAFEQRFRAICPIVARTWWETLDLDGEVEIVRIAFDPKTGPVASLTVRNIGLTIPFLSENIWGLYVRGKAKPARGMPRMHVEEGEIHLRGNSIDLRNLTGQLVSTSSDERLVGVPYHVNGTIGPIPSFDWEHRDDWFDQFINTVPLDLQFALNGFDFEARRDGRRDAVELPVVVTKIFEQFELKSCTLNTSINVTRGKPLASADGRPLGAPIRSAGTATLSGGRGQYTKFKYPLENVRAEIEFGDDELRIISLLGSGTAGGTVSISGRVWPLGLSPNIDLRISGLDVPLSPTLRDSFSGQFQVAYDALLDEPSYQALSAQGVIPNQDEIDQLEEQAISLIRERNQIAQDRLNGLIVETSAANSIESLDRRIQAFDRITLAPSFKMGGSVDFELNVAKESGKGNPTYTTGDIQIEDAGFVLRYFPYPVRIHSGRIHLERDRVEVVSWLGTALGGGRVALDGTIEMTRDQNGKRTIQPQLSIAIVDDMIHPALVAAISLAGLDNNNDSAQGEPDQNTESAMVIAARLLDAAGLEGFLTYGGDIGSDDSGIPTWTIAVELTEGRAHPNESMTATAQSVGLFWPVGFSLDRVEGRLSLTEDEIKIGSLTGHRNDGTVVVSESSVRVGKAGEAHFNFVFSDFALEEYLLNLFPQEDVGAAQEFWDQYNPEGIFDATLSYNRIGDEQLPLELTVTPKRVLLTVAGEQATVTGTDGGEASIALRENTVSFDNLNLTLQSGDELDGEVSLSGSYGHDKSELNRTQFALRGTLHNMRFDSPWIIEALLHMTSPEQVEQFRKLNATGRFDGSFVYSPHAPEGETSARIVIHPHDLGFTANGVPIRAQIKTDASVVIEDGRIRIEQLKGIFQSGATFAIAGDVSPGEPLIATLDIDYHGEGISDELAAILPQEVMTALRSIEFGVSDWIEITGARLELARIPVNNSERRYRWDRRFTGSFVVHGARLEAGLRFEEIDGRIDVDFASISGEPPTLTLIAKADRAVASKRELTNLWASFTLSADGKTLLLSDLHADSYGGTIAASATIDFGELGQFDAIVELIGVNLHDFSNAGNPDGAMPISATKGVIYGRIALEGVHGRPELLRGRGAVRIMEGRLASNPVTLPLLELAQLMIPFDASLDYAEAAFFIRGDQAIFEKILFESNRLLLFGDGSIDLNSFALDIRLQTRGRLLGISDVVGKINDQLYAIHVTGPLHDTTATIVALPGLWVFYRDDWVERRIQRRTLTTETSNIDHE